MRDFYQEEFLPGRIFTRKNFYQPNPFFSQYNTGIFTVIKPFILPLINLPFILPFILPLINLPFILPFILPLKAQFTKLILLR